MTVGCGVIVLSLIVVSSIGRELLFNNDGELNKLREILYTHMLYTTKLAKRLERIRGDPEDFYNDELAKDSVQDIKDGGSVYKFRSPRELLMVLHSSPGEWGRVDFYLMSIYEDDYLYMSRFWVLGGSYDFLNLTLPT